MCIRDRNLRAPHEVIARLTRVASKLPPGLFTRHKLAVIALEHGLAVIERDPSILLRGPASAAAPSAPEAPAAVPVPVPVPVPAAVPVPPEAPAERVARASRVVPAVASAPVVDPRQLPLTAAASNAPVSESTPSPSEPSADVDALTHANEVLRVRYRAGLAAGLFTPKDAQTALSVGESWPRMWAKGTIKKASAERLDALKSFLDAKGVPA